MVTSIISTRSGHTFQRRIPAIRYIGILTVLVFAMVLSGCNADESLREKNNRLTAELKSLKEENERLATELKSLIEENNQLMAELESLKEENSRLTAELENLRKDFESINYQLKQLAETVETVRKLLARKRYAKAAQLLESVAGDKDQAQNVNRGQKIAASIAIWLAIALLVLGFFGMGFFLVWAVLRDDDMQERIIRALTLMIGFLTYFGIRANVPDSALWFLVNDNLLYFVLISAITPFIIGVAVTAFVTQQLRSHSVFAHRLVILVSVFITIFLLDLFVNAFDPGLDPNALSWNLFFVIGAGFYLVFRFGQSKTYFRNYKN